MPAPTGDGAARARAKASDACARVCAWASRVVARAGRACERGRARTVLNRVLERQDAPLGLRLVADVRVLLAHANHHARLARAADHRREARARRVVARKARLHHAGAVVAHQGRNLVVSHCFARVWFVVRESARCGGGRGRGGEARRVGDGLSKEACGLRLTDFTRRSHGSRWIELPSCEDHQAKVRL